MPNAMNLGLFASIRNLSMVTKAKELLSSFIGDDDNIVYITNPDGSYLKLQPGFDCIALDFVSKEASDT